MALPKLTADLNIIDKLDPEPNDVGGLDVENLQYKFDEAGNTIKNYINDQLIPKAEEQFALRTELQNIVVGTIPEGTYATPADVTEVRELHTSELTAHAKKPSHVAAKIYAYKNIGGVM